MGDQLAWFANSEHRHDDEQECEAQDAEKGPQTPPSPLPKTTPPRMVAATDRIGRSNPTRTLPTAIEAV